MENLHLVLVDPNPTLCAEWKRAFDALPNVEIVNGYFEELPAFDCMVSAANSFGIMDGGVDAAITRFFGRQLMARVQARIVEEYLGEQPVGSSFVIETNHEQHPFLAHTPTMRVPMPITRTDNVYRAMWAMLLAIRQHNATADRKTPHGSLPRAGNGDGARAGPRSGAADGGGVWQLSAPTEGDKLAAGTGAAGPGSLGRRPDWWARH